MMCLDSNQSEQAIPLLAQKTHGYGHINNKNVTFRRAEKRFLLEQRNSAAATFSFGHSSERKKLPEGPMAMSAAM